MFVRSEDEIYALARHRDSNSLHLPSCIIKKKPESSSWDCVTSFDVGVREGMCVVYSDKFIYFIGGIIIIIIIIIITITFLKRPFPTVQRRYLQ